MKKNLFLGLAAVAMLASCTQSEVMETATETPMSFSAFVNKATKVPIAEITTVDFGVWGYKSKTNAENVPVFATQGTTAGATSDVAQTINYVSNVWSYTPLRYWDQTCSYKFYAYAPVNADVKATIAADHQISVTDFTVKSTIADQIDLLVAAEVSRDAKAMNQVHFVFGHVLTKVNVKFAKSVDADVVLKSATISGIQGKGTYVNGTWTPSTTADKISFASVELGAGKTLTTEAANVFTDMLMVPQAFVADQLNMALNYTINGETFTKTINLGTTAWTNNMSIVYTLTIAANAITFDTPTITDWAKDTTPGFTVNE